MSTLSTYSDWDLVHPADALQAMPDEPVRRQVWRLLAGLYPPTKVIERRIEQRFPYPQLVYLHPVTPDNLLLHDSAPIVVVGKHLSERGLGFFHRDPLPYRRIVASLEGHDGHWIGFLLDLTWCRFGQHGWYDSGGRFLQVIVSPLEQHAGDRR